MLPDGYTWQPYLDGPALYLERGMVAMVSPIPSGARVSLNVGTNRLRFVFLGDVRRAVAYVEAWARKWDREIRAGRAGSGPQVRHHSDGQAVAHAADAVSTGSRN